MKSRRDNQISLSPDGSPLMIGKTNEPMNELRNRKKKQTVKQKTGNQTNKRREVERREGRKKGKKKGRKKGRKEGGNKEKVAKSVIQAKKKYKCGGKQKQTTNKRDKSTYGRWGEETTAMKKSSELTLKRSTWRWIFQ